MRLYLGKPKKILWHTNFSHQSRDTMLSEQVENYLKHIYKLQEKQKRVTTSFLSEALSVSPASVSEMLKKLAEMNIVEYAPYRGVTLTPVGKKKSLKIIRRHRLWELFLVKVLKYQWDEIDEEAERLEHITSERLESRLDEFLGNPRFDPHGDIIPSLEGTVEQREYVSLVDCESGTTVVVSRVSDESNDVLQYLSKLGIGISKRIGIKERMEFDGSLRIIVDGKEQFISEKLANQVYIERT